MRRPCPTQSRRPIRQLHQASWAGAKEFHQACPLALTARRVVAAGLFRRRFQRPLPPVAIVTFTTPTRSRKRSHSSIAAGSVGPYSLLTRSRISSRFLLPSTKFSASNPVNLPNDAIFNFAAKFSSPDFSASQIPAYSGVNRLIGLRTFSLLHEQAWPR